jgi:5'-phosphate synthase pdxT subunit
MSLGVLALQGDFAEHQEALGRLEVPSRQVRYARDLKGLEGLILPGGESTTMLKLLNEENLLEPLRSFVRAGGALYGTCAGAILMANRVVGPEQASLGLLAMQIRRNAYGRQVDSHVSFEPCAPLGETPLEMVFIRAPVIELVDPSVAVLATHRGDPVFVRQGRLMATTFHPELTNDPRVHRYFVEEVVARS